MTTLVLYGIEKPGPRRAYAPPGWSGRGPANFCERRLRLSTSRSSISRVTVSNPPPQSNATAKSTPARSTPLCL